jgi:Putative zinc-finger
MKPCVLFDAPDIELYFYGELDANERVRVEAHLRGCDACRQRLDDLHTIRRALAAPLAVDAPPAGDWSGFMRRLDRSAEGLRSSDFPTPSLARRSAGSLRSRGSHTAFSRVPALAALAALLVITALGVFVAARLRHAPPATQIAPATSPATASQASPAAAVQGARSEERALRAVSAEHLERSKLVVLGLATLDPKRTHAADWQYERHLAGTLLDDTRLYRQAAQEHGMTDMAHVMRDLETVLIETSMSDTSDSGALARVQHLIARRDLVVKMQLVGAN